MVGAALQSDGLTFLLHVCYYFYRDNITYLQLLGGHKQLLAMRMIRE